MKSATGKHIEDFRSFTHYQCANKSNIFRKSDEKHITHHDFKNEQSRKNYKFGMHGFPQQEATYNKKDVPTVFKTTPDSLVNLACFVIDKMPFPSVFEWSNRDVCKWIRQYGYPHYQNTFRVNNITGRTLVLIGAQQLCAMNIKNFDAIKHITHGIRQIYGYQMVKFGRNKSLPPENYFEHHELYESQTGSRYQSTRRSDFWREMRLIRPACQYFQHWQLLDARMHPKNPPEVFADAPRSKLYRCKMAAPAADAAEVAELMCHCSLKCACSRKRTPTSHTRQVFTFLHERQPNLDFEKSCKCSFPPCTENWSSKEYAFDQVLKCLKQSFPYKYHHALRPSNFSLSRKSIFS